MLGLSSLLAFYSACIGMCHPHPGWAFPPWLKLLEMHSQIGPEVCLLGGSKSNYTESQNSPSQGPHTEAGFLWRWLVKVGVPLVGVVRLS